MAPNINEIAKTMNNIVVYEAIKHDLSVCELAAEMLTQMLMSEDCNSCHIHWLELQSKLELLITKA